MPNLEEEKEIVRVCGKNYSYLDIPPAIRKRELAEKESQRIRDEILCGEIANDEANENRPKDEEN